MSSNRLRHPHRCRYRFTCSRDIPCTLPVIIVLLGYCTQGLLSDCPRLCECKWKGGKEAVSCTNANLTTIPIRLDQGTQALDLTGNNLMRLKVDEFSKAGLLNLQKIYLTKCRLKIIERYAFRNLINLVELELSYNFLEMIPSHILGSMPELRELKLNGNSIQRIMNDAFQHVPKLIRLEVSYCRIGSIEPEAFNGLENLERLKLDGNRLNEVRAEAFQALKCLKGVELTSNPWNCTCSLRPLREWMLAQNIPSDVPPVCKYPKRLNGKSWQALELDEFACVPKILASDSKAHGIEGSSITISCVIDGTPDPDVKWLLRNKVIANHSSVTFYTGKKSYIVKAENNSSNLTIQTADVQDAGIYICAAENKAGRVEASVTLAVSKKPPEDTSQGKVIIAGIVVAIVLVSALCTLTACLISVRKRRQMLRWRNRRSASGRRHEENYEKIEMNRHKPTVNKANIPVASVASDVPLMGTVKKNGDYRVVPCIDTDQEAEVGEDEEIGYEDNTETPTPTNNVNKTPESKLWAAAATGRSISSPNSGHWNSNLIDMNLDPDDLHIPRRTKEETRDDCMLNQNSTFGTYNKSRLKPDSKTDRLPVVALGGNLTASLHKTIQPQLLRKQILQEGGSLYSSVPVSSTDLEKVGQNPAKQNKLYDTATRSGPSGLAKIFSGDGLSIHSDENMYCTLPRKKTGYKSTHNTRHKSFDSESPLLPGSAYGSSGGESSSGSRRFSEEYLFEYSVANILPRLNQKTGSYLNLAYSTQNMYPPSSDNTPLDSTPLLNVGALEKRYEEYRETLKSPSTKPLSVSSATLSYNFHKSQLAKRLEEYQKLESQLKKLKETCDNLRLIESYERLLKKRNHIKFLLSSNPAYSSDCDDSIPKSILKKSAASTKSRSPLFMTNIHHDSPGSSISTSSDFRKDTLGYWSSSQSDSQKELF